MTLQTLHPQIRLQALTSAHHLKQRSIQPSRPWKVAARINSIPAELLKADIKSSSKVWTDLFSKIWKDDTLPEDWRKGLIVKVLKKRNLSSCDSWQGITLLSIPSKVFCRILLKRIDSALDEKLRQVQAGFCSGWGCMDGRSLEPIEYLPRLYILLASSMNTLTAAWYLIALYQSLLKWGLV